MNPCFLLSGENRGYAAEELNLHSTLQGTPLLELSTSLCSPLVFYFHLP